MHVAYDTECLDGKLLPVTEGTDGRGYDKEGCFSVFSTAALQIWGIVVGVYVVVALLCACLALRLAKRSPLVPTRMPVTSAQVAPTVAAAGTQQALASRQNQNAAASAPPQQEWASADDSSQYAA